MATYVSSGDKNSTDFIFVPFCLMCRAFQAVGIVQDDYFLTIKPVLDLLIKSEINIIQLPCPESSFISYDRGLSRLPAGLKMYLTDEYTNHCLELSRNSLEMIKAIIKKGYNIKAILGIENSPSCAVNYIYSNKGMLKRSGVFIGILMRSLEEENITIPFMGINRRSTRKIIKALGSLL